MSDLNENELTYSDFDDGTVFKRLYAIQDPYEQAMAVERMARMAKDIKFTNFKALWKMYLQKQREVTKPVIEAQNGLTEFGEQDQEMDTGEWHADDLGIWKYGPGGVPVIACSHPIIPVMKKRSIDTKLLKYELAYRRGLNQKKDWSYVDIDAADMSSPNEIVKKLSPYGISVTGGDRAKALVDFLRDVVDKNYDNMPEVKCVSRVGWNEDGFSPYVSDTQFDGAQTFSAAYSAITEVGTMDAWMVEALDARQKSVTARIVLAASFAAPLIEPLGILPFFVHLWSTASGTGKTVGQMLGASVWGNPVPGGPFFPTFRSTSVGLELMAGFLHSLPFFIDELQLAKDTHGNVRFNVYELASGSGKLRGNRSLGLNYTPTWNMVFITSGETPITKETDGEGAINRVFEIECYADKKVVEDGHRTANALKMNYGHAGKLFIEKLMDGEGEIMERPNIVKARSIYEQHYASCITNDTTEKQAMAAAAILTADELATEWIFHDGQALTLADISEFLKTKERVSMMDRGYDILCDWVAINAHKLKGYKEDDRGDVYGVIDEDVAYIIRSVFTKVCADNEINEKGFLSHLKTRKLIETNPNRRGFTVVKDLGDHKKAACVALLLPSESDDSGTGNAQVGLKELAETDELPF